jgi:hypothetical protein
MATFSSTSPGSVVKLATRRFIEIDKWSLSVGPNIARDDDYKEGDPVNLSSFSGRLSGTYNDAAAANAFRKVALKGQSVPLLLRTGDGGAYMGTAFLECVYDTDCSMPQAMMRVSCTFKADNGPLVFYADATGVMPRRRRYRRK